MLLQNISALERHHQLSSANALPTVEHHLNRAKEIKDHIDHPNATARR
jgi:hypothetical protein